MKYVSKHHVMLNREKLILLPYLGHTELYDNGIIENASVGNVLPDQQRRLRQRCQDDIQKGATSGIQHHPGDQQNIGTTDLMGG